MEQLKNESSRQYEYMEEMKKWVQKKSGELGRKLTCHVTTFGCQMNEKDSEKLLGILETIGYEEVEREKSTDDDRVMWMYDAGRACDREDSFKL